MIPVRIMGCTKTAENLLLAPLVIDNRQEFGMDLTAGMQGASPRVSER